MLFDSPNATAVVTMTEAMGREYFMQSVSRRFLMKALATGVALASNHLAFGSATRSMPAPGHLPSPPLVQASVKAGVWGGAPPSWGGSGDSRNEKFDSRVRMQGVADGVCMCACQ